MIIVFASIHIRVGRFIIITIVVRYDINHFSLFLNNFFTKRSNVEIQLFLCVENLFK